jgi:heme iron utilization protein
MSDTAQSAAPLPGMMPERLPENTRQPDDFNPVAVAKTLLRATRAGALATIDRNTGHPFASLVNIATDVDGSPFIAVSRLSTHTANIERDPRASLLLAATGRGDPLAHPRLTVLGSFAKVERAEPEGHRLRRRFLSHHPKSQLYIDLPDFTFWRLSVVAGHLNGGFARARDLTAGEFMTDIAGAEEMIEIEEGAIEHMNADHADALRLYATRLLGETDGPWKVTGIDPDGLDLALGDRMVRMAFAERVADGSALRKILADYGKRARAM